MCLDTRFKPETEKKMIAKLPDGLITVYKIVRKKNSSYHPLFWGSRFRVGLNHAKACAHYSNFRGFHVFKTQRGAMNSYTFISRRAVVKMQIRRGWITAIGRHGGCLGYVTDRIISPSLRDKSAIVE